MAWMSHICLQNACTYLPEGFTSALIPSGLKCREELKIEVFLSICMYHAECIEVHFLQSQHCISNHIVSEAYQNTAIITNYKL